MLWVAVPLGIAVAVGVWVAVLVGVAVAVGKGVGIGAAEKAVHDATRASTATSARMTGTRCFFLPSMTWM